MAESSRDEIAKLEALYANNPEGRVFTHLAEAYRKAGELDRARTILEEGLGRHSGYASAHVVLGRVLLDQHDSTAATEAFERVLGLDPHNLVALRSLGDLARAAGRRDEAVGYFEALQHQDPNNEEITAILEELRTPEAAAVEEVAPAAAEAPAQDWEHPAALEPEAPVEEPAAEEFAPVDIGELPDLGFGWSVEEPEEEEAGLPGDLGALALPTFDEPEPEPAAQAEPAPMPDPEPVNEIVTETMGDLYRSQGLHDRAADVYRTLLSQRPGDVGLEQKLREVEEVRERSEAWIASGEVAETSAPTPYAWTEAAAEEDDAGPTIAAYFDRLLAWRPTATEPEPEPIELEEIAFLDAPVVEERVAEHLSFEDAQTPVDAHSDIEKDVEFTPPEPAEMVLGEEMVADSFYDVELPEPEAPPAPPAPAPLPDIPGVSDDAMPWEEPAAAAPPAAPAVPAYEPPPASAGSEATTADAAFDEWFGPTEPAPAQTSSAPGPTPTPAEGEGGEGDDDDLEMFRSWLQSLKK